MTLPATPPHCPSNQDKPRHQVLPFALLRVLRGYSLPEPGFDLRPPSGFIPPMPRKVSEIVEEARQLPYGERAELIEQLIADSAKNLDPEIEKAWGDEAMRRLAEMESGKVKPVPTEEVMARARKIIGRK